MPVPFTCPHCGHQTVVNDQYVGQTGPCSGCGQIVTVLPPNFGTPVEPLGENAAVRMLLPVGRSYWAIAAGYFGLFSVLFFPAPIAVILGIIAIFDIKRHPDRHGMGRAIFGLLMGAMFTLLMLFGLIVGAMNGFK
jgi:hypothetical protein